MKFFENYYKKSYESYIQDKKKLFKNFYTVFSIDSYRIDSLADFLRESVLMIRFKIDSFRRSKHA